MDLPKVFQNRNISNIDNAQQYYYNKSVNTNTKEIKNNINIDDKINNILKSKSFVYKINVLITTKTDNIDTAIIGKVNKNLITINNELIPIKDILDINEK